MGSPLTFGAHTGTRDIQFDLPKAGCKNFDRISKNTLNIGLKSVFMKFYLGLL